MKKRILFFVTIISLLRMTASCTNDNQTEDAPQTYNVGGTVTKSDGGAAAGASVMLTSISDGSDAGQSPVNAAGEYIITGLGTGSYKLVATLNGYETGTVEMVNIANADVTVNEIVLQKITVPTYSIEGVVGKPDGSTAAGVSVQVRKSGDNTNVGQAVKTDASGAYSTGDIPAGSYNIIFTLEGYETGILAGVIVNNVNLTARNITLQTMSISSGAISIVFSDNDATISNLPADGSVTATKSGADVTIASSASGTVEYDVSGSTSGGSLKIQNNATLPNTLRLTLNSAVIASTSKLPPIQITKNEGLTIVELKGSSILSDNSSNEENATLISKSGSLQFEGYGKLNINGAVKHAISSEKTTVVRDGDITVTSALSDGFHSEGFEISGGSLDITASGDGMDAGEGTAIITGGHIRINSSANDTKGIKADAGVTVEGGSIEMTVSGAQSKGVGSKADITINSGDIYIITSGSTALTATGSGYDPSYCTAIKSDQNIYINGGTIKIESRQTSDGGRGVSADGDVVIRGGTLDITTAGAGKVYTSSTGATDSYTATCIKANKNISLSGGNITCSSSGTGGKGVSADGTITVGLAGANNADLILTVGTSGERFTVSGSSGGGQGGRPGMG
ncbi:MAG: carbohydrate-binding domain-containing protein, partial [Tannerella sp.]|nr:carbohydrate-binding domain-containing protein [Tannerella sp.]